MAILTCCWIIDLIIITTSFFLLMYLYFLHQYRFWKKLGVKHTNPSIPYGDFKGLGSTISMGEAYKDIYEKHKEDPMIGFWIFHTPILLVKDPELIKTVFVKDFSSYQDRGMPVNEDFDKLSATLFNLGGVKWRNLRAKMTPTFTSGKMKMMFSTLVECSEVLKEVLQAPAQKGEIVEMKEIAARFTTDIISSVAFGIETNSLKNPDAIFREMGRKIMEPNLRNTVVGMIMMFAPRLQTLLRIPTVPAEVTKFFTDTVKETITYREENNVKRNDFMHLMIELMHKGQIQDVDEGADGGKGVRNFTFDEALSQVFLFFVAGFETSSTTMQFALYELAVNPDIQEKAREEVLKVLADNENKMTYDTIYGMHYLGRVIDETLRKFPPVAFLLRETNKTVELGGKVLPPGIKLQIPVIGLQRDPQYYPNPDKFDPERFTEEEKAKRPHFSYLPFGEGPRNCIGMRFGLMQTRVGLAALLSNFKFEVCKETPIPMVFDPKAFVLSPKDGMKLKITKLSK